MKETVERAYTIVVVFFLYNSYRASLQIQCLRNTIPLRGYSRFSLFLYHFIFSDRNAITSRDVEDVQHRVIKYSNLTMISIESSIDRRVQLIMSMIEG